MVLVLVVLGVGLALGACTVQNDPAVDEMSQRLEEVEKQLAFHQSEAASADKKLKARLEELENSVNVKLKGLDSLSQRLGKVEDESLELYDDAIDQIMTVRDSLAAQISKIRSEIEERKLQKLLESDLTELTEMLAGGGVELDSDNGRIVVQGSICQTDALVEFAAVGEGGRDHESLLYVECTPSLLNAGLLSLGLSAGEPYRVIEKVPGAPEGGIEVGEDDDPLLYYLPSGPLVQIDVEWTVDGETVSHRLEDLLTDRTTGEAMPRKGWVYLGSRFGSNDETGEEVYVADWTRDLISNYTDH